MHLALVTERLAGTAGFSSTTTAPNVKIATSPAVMVVSVTPVATAAMMQNVPRVLTFPTVAPVTIVMLLETQES